jgi:NhaP-type Na+/H+ and K+/H+ antiporter
MGPAFQICIVLAFTSAAAVPPLMLDRCTAAVAAAAAQIMLLAWPGVVIQFLLIALCAKYFFPYGWTWPEAFLFGAMLSATDPVAVVAVLQEVRGSSSAACSGDA